MSEYAPTSDELESTAIHEAGHAVLHISLGLGCTAVTIQADLDEMSAGHAVHGGEWGEKDEDAETLRLLAEDAFWLRHAIASYAGAEAQRQLRPHLDPDDVDAGARSDDRMAVDAIDRISSDPQTIELCYALARRRCKLLVQHYAPEIGALAKQLLERGTLSGAEARTVVVESLDARGASFLLW